MRTLFIWLFGLLAGAIAGGIIGAALQPNQFGGFWGLILGMAAFSCAKLWAGRKVAP